MYLFLHLRVYPSCTRTHTRASMPGCHRDICVKLSNLGIPLECLATTVRSTLTSAPRPHRSADIRVRLKTDLDARHTTTTGLVGGQGKPALLFPTKPSTRLTLPLLRVLEHRLLNGYRVGYSVRSSPPTCHHNPTPLAAGTGTAHLNTIKQKNVQLGARALPACWVDCTCIGRKGQMYLY